MTTVKKIAKAIFRFTYSDEDGNVIAGILSGTYWGWMHLDILWVDENYRRRGIGSKLLKAAEEEAVRRGCHYL